MSCCCCCFTRTYFKWKVIDNLSAEPTLTADHKCRVFNMVKLLKEHQLLDLLGVTIFLQFFQLHPDAIVFFNNTLAKGKQNNQLINTLLRLSRKGRKASEQAEKKQSKQHTKALRNALENNR